MPMSARFRGKKWNLQRQLANAMKKEENDRISRTGKQDIRAWLILPQK